jgi:cobalt/nickel transport system permease protein
MRRLPSRVHKLICLEDEMLLSIAPMHIPDGFLSTLVSVVLWLITIIVVGYALKRVSADLGERQVPLMGVLAAAIFAGQMLNFTVVGGTSGHLMGAAIATILLGPWAAMLVLTCVVGIQALIFQDGGLLVMGANIFNMGIIGVTVSFFTYQTVKRLAGGRPWGIYAGGFIAAWLSIFVAALATALELAFSNTSPANIAIPAMAAIHALIGIGEGLITLGALAFIYSTRPDLLNIEGKTPVGGKAVWVAGLLIALVLAIASPLASAYPDGLIKVAGETGFLSTAREPLYNLIPKYAFPGISNKTLATILAAILGTLIVFFVALAVAYTRRKKK